MRNKKLHLMVLLLLIGLTVGFIWINSAISGEESGAISGQFKVILDKVLVFVHCPDRIRFFLIEHVRKVGHAVEYFVIGGELAFLWSDLGLGFQGLWNAWSTVLSIAVLDETIQLFATARGPQLTDVLLDTVSGSMAILIVYLCCLISYSITKSELKQRRAEVEQ